jgi:hypothetical protein
LQKIIEYALPRAIHVILKVYSILGEEVATLVEQQGSQRSEQMMMSKRVH